MNESCVVRRCVVSLAVFLVLCCPDPGQCAASGMPNVVLINADDLGYGDLGCYGAVKVKTPHIDQLARQGRLFTDAHCASAVCSPSRYGLLTGRYPLRRNFWGPISFRTGLTIDPRHLTIGRLMKEAGYATACIGKWHLGFGTPEPDWNGELKPGPLELGFDHYFGIPQVSSGPPFVYVQDHRVLGWDPNDPFVYGKRSVTQVWPAKNGYTQIGGARAAHELYQDQLVGTTLRRKATPCCCPIAGELVLTRVWDGLTIDGSRGADVNNLPHRVPPHEAPHAVEKADN